MKKKILLYVNDQYHYDDPDRFHVDDDSGGGGGGGDRIYHTHTSRLSSLSSNHHQQWKINNDGDDDRYENTPVWYMDHKSSFRYTNISIIYCCC